MNNNGIQETYLKVPAQIETYILYIWLPLTWVLQNILHNNNNNNNNNNTSQMAPTMEEMRMQARREVYIANFNLIKSNSNNEDGMRECGRKMLRFLCILHAGIFNKDRKMYDKGRRNVKK
jgi:hypothetical protein